MDHILSLQRKTCACPCLPCFDSEQKTRSRVVICFWSTTQLLQWHTCPGCGALKHHPEGCKVWAPCWAAWPPSVVASCLHGSQSHPGAIISVPVTASQIQSREQKARAAFGRKWPRSLQVFVGWPSVGWVRLQHVLKGQEHLLCSFVPSQAF